MEKHQNPDVYSHRARGTLGGGWVLGQQGRGELTGEGGDKKRVCLLLKAAKVIGYRSEKEDLYNVVCIRKDTGNSSSPADMRTQNLDLLDRDLPPTHRDSPTDARSFGLEASYNHFTASPPPTPNEKQIPAIAFDRGTLLEILLSEPNSLQMGPVPFCLTDSHQNGSLPRSVSDLLSQNMGQDHRRDSFSQNLATTSSCLYFGVPSLISNGPSVGESASLREATPTNFVPSVRRTRQTPPILICANLFELESGTAPLRHRGLRKVQAQHSLRKRVVIPEQSIKDKNDQNRLSASYTTRGSQYARKSTLLGNGKVTIEPRNLVNPTKSTTYSPRTFDVANTLASHTTTDISLSSVEPFRSDKGPLVSSPTDTLTSNTMISLPQVQEVNRKAVPKTDVVLQETTNDITRKNRDERKWEEITEPADLQICLAILKREIQRRREEIKAGVVDVA